jgi:hypothetical protein
MTKDEIICMAFRAGIFHEYDSEGQWDGLTNEALGGSDWLICKDYKLDRIFEILAPFAALVAQAERDELYKIVMDAPFRQNVETEENGEDLLFALKAMAFDITSAIRAREQHE